jgi:hypothetical protein
MRAGEVAAGDRADLPETLGRHEVLVGRDLEDRIGRRVEDRTPAREVLGAELSKDLGPRSGPVAEEPHARGALDRLDDLLRKSFGEDGKRRSVASPIISQCPQVESLPAETSRIRPQAPCGGEPGRPAARRRPRRSRFGSSTPVASITWPRVSLPVSP